MSSMKSIKIAGIEPESIVDGEGIRYVIFTQGCPHHCLGCQNPQTHSFKAGKLIKIDKIITDIEKNMDYLDGITLSGGEPFCQAEQCSVIAEKSHEMGLSVWCYTGYLYEELLKNMQVNCTLLENVDILVDGPFVLKEKSLDLPYCGSKNQRIIDVPASLNNKSVFLKNF